MVGAGAAAGGANPSYRARYAERSEGGREGRI